MASTVHPTAMFPKRLLNYAHRGAALPETWAVDRYCEDGYTITAKALLERCK